MSCSCGKKSGSCSCIPVGPIGPQGPAGQAGQRGSDGLGIRQSYVSDGITPIGNIIYPVNTLVFQMTDYSYQSAGLVFEIAPLNWIDMVLENGWATSAVTTQIAQYAISNGFLYMRGFLNGAAATNATFTTIANMGFSNTAASEISEYTGVNHKLITASSGGLLRIPAYSTAIHVLDTVPPISIR